jgi:hypothetical protein
MSARLVNKPVFGLTSVGLRFVSRSSTPARLHSVVYPGRRQKRLSHRRLISLHVDVVGHVLVNGLNDRVAASLLMAFRTAANVLARASGPNTASRSSNGWPPTYLRQINSSAGESTLPARAPCSRRHCEVASAARADRFVLSGPWRGRLPGRVGPAPGAPGPSPIGRDGIAAKSRHEGEADTGD